MRRSVAALRKADHAPAARPVGSSSRTALYLTSWRLHDDLCTFRPAVQHQYGCFIGELQVRSGITSRADHPASATPLRLCAALQHACRCAPAPMDLGPPAYQPQRSSIHTLDPISGCAHSAGCSRSACWHQCMSFCGPEWGSDSAPQVHMPGACK